MKKFAIVLTVLIFVAGCKPNATGTIDTSVLKNITVYEENAGSKYVDFSYVITKGNRSYIPLNYRYDASTNDGANIVLDVLNEFEKKHPEQEIVAGSLCIIERPSRVFGYKTIAGLYIEHRSREGK